MLSRRSFEDLVTEQHVAGGPALRSPTQAEKGPTRAGLADRKTRGTIRILLRLVQRIKFFSVSIETSEMGGYIRGVSDRARVGSNHLSM